MGCCGNDVSDEPKSYDPSFKGPIKNRSCTDIICCLLFFVFIIGYIVIGIFAWLNGDPLILLRPTDTQGRICGLNYGDLDLSGKNNLFFFDLTKCASPATSITFQCPTTQVCVTSCPTDYWTYLPDLTADVLAVIPNANRTAIAASVDWTKYICQYGYNPRQQFISNTSIQAIINSGNCAPYYLPMTSVVDRCIPDISDAVNAVTYAYNATTNVALATASNESVTGGLLQEGTQVMRVYLDARDIAEKIFADFTASWFWLLVAFAIAAVVAFLWIGLMRWIAGIIIWTILLALVALFAIGIWYCYDEYNRLMTFGNSNTSIITVGFTTNLDTYLALQDTWLAFFIILVVLEVILLILIIFLRKRIMIAIEIIKEGSRAIGHMISTLFFPLVTFTLLVISIGFWVATALFMAASANPVYKVVDERNLTGTTDTSIAGQACDITEWLNQSHPFYMNGNLSCVFERYGGDSVFHQNVLWLQIIAVFGMLWIANWILALGIMTLSGAFASYYWAWKKPGDIPHFPVFSSFARALRYHTGSMAFGALLIAIVQLIRILLEYIDHKVRDKTNVLAKIILCCCKCCFWCLEKFLQFISRNAYIMVAIYGKNFCWSAKEALGLILRNVVRAVVLDQVIGFLLFIGKLLVASLMGALAWAFFTDKITAFTSIAPPRVNYYWMLIAVIFVGSYFIAAAFFNTYSTATDCLFLCFLEDLERNDGSEEKPYYMSKGLMKVLGKKNKKRKQKKKD